MERAPRAGGSGDPGLAVGQVVGGPLPDGGEDPPAARLQSQCGGITDAGGTASDEDGFLCHDALRRN